MGHLPSAAGHGQGAPEAVPPRLGLADFGEGGAGEACPPGAGLHAVLAGLCGPEGRCPGASDDELVGLLARWAAVESRAAAARLGVLRELIRRRPAPGASAPPGGGMRGDLPQAWDEGTAHEVSAALAVSLRAADAQLSLAWELGARLPGIGARLAGGVISELKARIVAEEFKVLDDDLTRRAEALIVGKLAGKTPGQIGAMAARAVVTVDPEGARKRRERAERDEARVRFWRERAGTSALAAYGLPTDQALAANANIRARAAQYRKSRAFPGVTMDQLRVQAYLDMLNGVPAEARIAGARAAAEPSAQAGTPPPDEASNCPSCRAPGGACACEAERARHDTRNDTGDDADGDADGDAGDDDGGDGDSGDGPADGGDPRDGPPSGPGRGPGGTGHRDAVPALSDLIIPLLTLLGLAERPGEGYGLGPLDPGLARDLAATAARSPDSEWSVTVIDPQGYAIGHGLAKPARGSPAGRPSGPPGRLPGLPARVNLTIPLVALLVLRRRASRPPHPGEPPQPPQPGQADSPPPSDWTLTPLDDPGPADGYGTWRLTLPGRLEFTVRFVPVPVRDCDHRNESHAYQPNETLRRLVQVRDGTCTFPTCSSHARESDFEHATPYDKGGRTCACNAGARSRRCHRVKQSRGWAVTQPRPGWHRWVTPAGRTYTRGPMEYPA